MRALIVDDEAPARSRLARLVDALDGWEVAGEAADGLDALAQVSAVNPDVVLLDVRMPRMDGMEAARHLAALETPPAVIFTTAYDEYALAAFDTHAVAYLLKPVRGDRLAAALQHACRPSRAQLGALNAGGRRQHLAARIGERLQLVPVARVRAFSADNKYVVARYPDGELVLSETLKELEQEFADTFIRVHRNTLVAVEHVESFDGERVTLAGIDTPVEVSRRHSVALRKFLRGR
ncbi:MAG: LytTR family DNA-binding domain-containing protein [Gammaproteobacteria bacterium]